MCHGPLAEHGPVEAFTVKTDNDGLLVEQFSRLLDYRSFFGVITGQELHDSQVVSAPVHQADKKEGIAGEPARFEVDIEGLGGAGAGEPGQVAATFDGWFGRDQVLPVLLDEIPALWPLAGSTGGDAVKAAGLGLDDPSGDDLAEHGRTVLARIGPADGAGGLQLALEPCTIEGFESAT